MGVWIILRVLMGFLVVSDNYLIIPKEVTTDDEVYLTAGTLSQGQVLLDHPIHNCHGGELMNDFLGNFDLSKLKTKLESCPRILYNRLPKCGSRAIASTLLTSGVSDSVNIVTPDPGHVRHGHRSMTDAQQATFVEYFYSQPLPLCLTWHMFYTDFTRFHHSQPLYINVMRDPIERVVSHYYFYSGEYNSSAGYGSTNEHLYDNLNECIQDQGMDCYRWFADIVLPYFCGHEKACRERDVSALDRAIHNIENEYLVVGLTDDLPAFFEIMEAIYPKVFRNSRDAFLQSAQQLKSMYGKRVEHPPLDEVFGREMSEYLRLDYQLYEYVRERFYRILDAVRKAKRNAEQYEEFP